jgi:hypothetical protein
MKSFIIFSSFVVGLLLLTSCTAPGSKGKIAKAEEKSRAKIVDVENAQIINNSQKLDEVASLAYGTDYALSKVVEPTPAITVARDINQRVISLTGSSTVEKMKEMQEIIDSLTSQLDAERESGKMRLSAKDGAIAFLQAEGKALMLAKESEIHKYMAQAQDAAAFADSYKVELDKMNSYFGLGAIWYGLKKFIVSSMWILGIGGILFFIIRIASVSNPICGAIFGIFEQVASWFINAIRIVFPKAIQFAGHVSSDVYNASRNILRKIVDNIQNLKELETRNGHDITLKELLLELEKKMDSSEKEMIAEINKSLGY